MDMSLSEIIDELPRLSHQERRELCRRVIDLESEHDDMMLCDHIAREGFAMLDRIRRRKGPVAEHNAVTSGRWTWALRAKYARVCS
jgi:hypothetical protein